MVYSSHGYDRPSLQAAATGKHEMTFTHRHLNSETVSMAKGFDAVAIFTSDDASALMLQKLADAGVRYLALRSSGYDHVDLSEAKRLGIRVAHVPEYSPYAIAEHAVAMMLAANRKLVEAHALIQLQDFRLDTLTGFDVHGKTVGIIGTGKIGMAFASIMKGFGTQLLAFDPIQNPAAPELGIKYTTLDDLLKQCDIISIHCPLTNSTRHLMAKPQFDKMKPGAMIINTSRGGVIKTTDLIDAIERGVVGMACLDVYENEKGLFFEDHRQDVLKDPLFARLRSLKNVMITGHQAFMTNEAIAGITRVTIANLDFWQQGVKSPNELEVHVSTNLTV